MTDPRKFHTISNALPTDIGGATTLQPQAQYPPIAAPNVSAGQGSGQTYGDAIAASSQKAVASMSSVWDSLVAVNRRGVDKMVEDLTRLERELDAARSAVTKSVEQRTNRAEFAPIGRGVMARGLDSAAVPNQTPRLMSLPAGNPEEKHAGEGGLTGLATEVGKDAAKKLEDKGFEKLMDTSAAKALGSAVKGLALRVTAAAPAAGGLATAMAGAAIAGVTLGETIKLVARKMGATGRWTESLSHYYADVAHIGEEAQQTEKRTFKLTADRKQRDEVEASVDQSTARYAEFQALATDVARNAAWRKGGDAEVAKVDQEQFKLASQKLSNAKEHLIRGQYSGDKALNRQAVEEGYKAAITAKARIYEREERNAEQARERSEILANSVEQAKSWGENGAEGQSSLAKLMARSEQSQRDREAVEKRRSQSGAELSDLERQQLEFVESRYEIPHEPKEFQPPGPVQLPMPDRDLYGAIRGQLEHPYAQSADPSLAGLMSQWQSLPLYRQANAKLQLQQQELENGNSDKMREGMERAIANLKPKAAQRDALRKPTGSSKSSDAPVGQQIQHVVPANEQTSTDAGHTRAVADAASAAHVSVANSEQLVTQLAVAIKDMAQKNQDALKRVHSEVRRAAAMTNYGNNVV